MASDSPRTVNGFLVFVGSVIAFVGVTLIAVAVLALNRPKVDSVEPKRAAQRLATREKLEKEAAEKLESTGWVDKAKGIAHVPVYDAFPIVAEQLKSKKPGPSQVKVEPPLPMPVIDPTSAEPPPPALPSSPQGADLTHFVGLVAPATPAPVAVAPATPAAAAPAPAPAAPAPAPTTPAPAPATPAPVPATPAPAPATPAPAPATPAPATPAPVTLPVPAAPLPPPAVPAPEAPAAAPVPPAPTAPAPAPAAPEPAAPAPPAPAPAPAAPAPAALEAPAPAPTENPAPAK